MESSVTLFKGFCAGFIAAQFVPIYISGPIVFVVCLIYGTASNPMTRLWLNIRGFIPAAILNILMRLSHTSSERPQQEPYTDPYREPLWEPHREAHREPLRDVFGDLVTPQTPKSII